MLNMVNVQIARDRHSRKPVFERGLIQFEILDGPNTMLTMRGNAHQIAATSASKNTSTDVNNMAVTVAKSKVKDLP